MRIISYGAVQSFTARDSRTTAIALDPIVSKIATEHPHASSRLSSLRTLRFPGSTAGVRASPSGDPSIMHVDENATPTSNTSFIVPLSVWQPAISSSSHDRRPTVIMSVPRSGSLAASASMSSTSALSYASSVSCAPPEYNSPHPKFARVVRMTRFLTRLVGLWTRFATVTPAEEGPTSEEQRPVPLSSASGKSASVLALAVGTSGFQSRRSFDVWKEHRSYCPYVIRSVVVSSLQLATVIGTSNVSDNGVGLVEGWRTTLTDVQRHKLGQRQRMSRFVPGSESAEGT
ncbi:hypothetical protein EDD17DRAFT_1753737 [Pisolithus thermaeus]|nr:hypothetical protein EV401DRAFT_2080938 [Pisolithus croceorrhizus]KAI6165574.1 hypothetical protein EDD17DRAFT_1753737 [Pisolithus thermaeus]